MKPITIEKIPEGDDAREGARSHLRARALALRQAQRPRGMAGANARERRK